MTKFEQAAINRQYMAYRKVCCMTGRRANCDKCNVAYVHRLVIAALDEKEQKNKKK